MFDHSIKVPRLYKTAAQIYKDVQEGKGSIKQLLYQKKHPNIKAIYALIVETFKKQNELDNLLKRTQLLAKEPRLDAILARILVTELLYGKKRLAGESKPVKTILAYQQKFKAHLSDVESKFSTKHEDESSYTPQVQKPRYLRVNTLQLSTNEALESFRDEEWNLVRFTDTRNYEGFLETASNLGPDDFMVDIHIPNLLLFHPKAQFYQHIAYKNGKIVLQDKASCIPVHILNPPPGSVVLDMCAAPGMKTTQIAALLNNEGVVYAVEVNNQRYQTLNKIVNLVGANCVQTLNKDVLTVTNNDCPNVEYILVDPSCSGSGMDRLDFQNNHAENIENRLNKLASFQIKILRYALSRFPKAKRVVYSTCSIYPEENEDVVRQVLETCTNFKLVPAGDFLDNNWINFGSSNYGKIGDYCLYAKPEVDLTNGFFVAVFERLGEGEENQFLNKNMYDKPSRIRKNKNYTGQNAEESSSQVENVDEKGKKKKKKLEDDAVKSEETVGADEVKAEKLKKTKNKVEEIEEICTIGLELGNTEESDLQDSSQIENNQENIDGKKSRKKKKKLEDDSVRSEETVDTEEVKAKKLKKPKNKVEEIEEICTIGLELGNTEESNMQDSSQIENNLENIDGKKSRKKKKKLEEDAVKIEETVDTEEEKSKKTKKTKNKKVKVTEITPEIENSVEESHDSKRKKKKQTREESCENNDESDDCVSKKKKKKKEQNCDGSISNQNLEEELLVKKKKKKNKQ